MLDTLDDLPRLAGRAHGEAELEAFRRPVLALADDGERVPIAPRGRLPDAVHRVDDRVRGRRRGRQAALLDHLGAALLHRLDELAAQPAVVLDHLRRRQADDARVLRVRVLRRRVIPPDRHVGDDVHRHAGLPRELRLGAVLVEPRHREPAVGRHVRCVAPRDQAVRVARVADHEDAHVVGGVGVDRLTLRLEDLAVHREQVAALHALLARDGPDEQRPGRAVESGLEVARRLDSREQRERTVVELHGDALEGLHRRLDLQEAQHHRLVGAEEVAARDPEEERVADLSGGAGDRHVDRSLRAVGG